MQRQFRYLFTLVFTLAAFCRAAQPETAPAEKPDDADPDMALAFKLERAFQKLAKKVAPAVVSLQVSTRSRNWNDDLRSMSEHYNPGALERKSEGSGVVVDPTGYILTNEHVVRDSDSITVTFSDGRIFPAKIAGTDARSDLAMVVLTGDDVPKDLPCAQFADSDKIQIGQYAMAVGNPFGLSNSVTLGVISARGRSRPGPSGDVFYGNLIQVDTPINPGNSGGPLFDLSGHVIGINTMIYSRTGVSQACGLAIPSNHVKPRLDLLKNGSEVEYGWLGVQLDEIAAQKFTFKVPDNRGVLVNGVIANTPADRAGIARGTVILDVDGTRVGSVDELKATVNELPIGRLVKVKALDTAGRTVDYSVRISKRFGEVALARQKNPNIDLESMAFELDDLEPGRAPFNDIGKADPEDAKTKPFIWRGMQFMELSADDAKKKGGRIEIVRVKTGSPADRAGLYEGAIVAELKHAGDKAIQKLARLDDLKKIAAQVTGPASLYVVLDGYVTVDEK
ncbi:MAG TPA: trypsin-like peptidase domain-containing protein [Planctomycetota bacterium]|nr:trypsin-like peptidase domain-containing protein [Planctomycetota bacterium]